MDGPSETRKRSAAKSSSSRRAATASSSSTKDAMPTDSTTKRRAERGNNGGRAASAAARQAKPPAKKPKTAAAPAAPKEAKEPPRKQRSKRSNTAASANKAVMEGATGGQPSQPVQSSTEPKLWCSVCSRPAVQACAASGHALADVASARRQAAAALRAALAALDGLDDLEREGAPCLRATVEVEGLGLGRSSECIGDVLITLCLREGDLAGGGAEALCALVNALDMQNFDRYLSASPAHDEDLRPHRDALAGLLAKLPERVDGIALRAGAILVLDSDDAEGQMDEDEVADEADGNDNVGLDDSFSPTRHSWLSRPSRLATLVARKSAPVVATGRKTLPARSSFWCSPTTPTDEDDDDEVVTEEDDDSDEEDDSRDEGDSVVPSEKQLQQSPLSQKVAALRVQKSASSDLSISSSTGEQRQALQTSSPSCASASGPNGCTGSEKWSPAVRIYYDRRVKLNEAKGARILGYITRNLEHVGAAKPRGPYHQPGWGMRNHDGHGVRFSDAKLVPKLVADH